jgi:hypothetical protein
VRLDIAGYNALVARIEALENIIRVQGANVSIRPPGQYGSVIIEGHEGSKIIETKVSPGIPNDFAALGFFGTAPAGKGNIAGDWNGGAPDDANQSLAIGTMADSVGNQGYGLLQDNRTNL